jgi:hypothetical protein
MVMVGNTSIAMLTVDMGAPHRSVLGPLQYSLFTHDCMTRHDSNTIIKFSDVMLMVGLITGSDHIPSAGRSVTLRCGARTTTSHSTSVRPRTA